VCYPLIKGDKNMPNKIIIEDIINEIIENINCIKLNTYLKLESKR
jgi:hypothetical protein